MTLNTRDFGWLRAGLGNEAAARAIETFLALGQVGRVFYYDPTSGGASNSADRPDDANSKLQNVIDKTVAARGDVIVCMRGTETVTETVNFNKSGITLIPETMGLNPSALGEFNALLADASFTDGPVATITAPCAIYGMGFVSRDTGSQFFSGAAALIGGLASAAPFGVVLSGCRFPKWGLTNRIGLAIEGGSDLLIDRCTFEGVGSDFEAGIYLQGATANLEIRDSKFTDCDYALVIGAITGGGPGPDLDFHGNRILGADSKGINTGGGSGRGSIWNNYFNTDQGAATFDGTTDALDTQGYQLIGNFYKDESTGPT